MIFFKTITLAAIGTIMLTNSCKKTTHNNVEPGITLATDPNFTIVSHADAGFTSTSKKAEVFGIPIYAVEQVENAKLLHAANIMAQYLDNNEDGVVDNQQVLTAMKNANAFMIMWKRESDLDNMAPPTGTTGQDLGNDETIPAWHTNGQTGQFDASLEEVWHIITHAGYANAYPSIFGEQAGTSLTIAMDSARGGNFTSIPNPYPANAWYTYDDQTCGYNCMATEYFYWAMTSMLGAQQNRLSEIQQEWKLNTRTKVQNTDNRIFNLLTNPQYKLPTVLPDGTYKH